MANTERLPLRRRCPLAMKLALEIARIFDVSSTGADHQKRRISFRVGFGRTVQDGGRSIRTRLRKSKRKPALRHGDGVASEDIKIGIAIAPLMAAKPMSTNFKKPLMTAPPIELQPQALRFVPFSNRIVRGYDVPIPATDFSHTTRTA
jgi:hypothetical protein